MSKLNQLPVHLHIMNKHHKLESIDNCLFICLDHDIEDLKRFKFQSLSFDCIGTFRQFMHNDCEISNISAREIFKELFDTAQIISTIDFITKHEKLIESSRDYDPELNNALEDKAFTAPSEDIGRVEYRVKKREVHFITRYVEIGKSSSVNEMGEFNDPSMAYEVAYGMARLEHQKLGWQPDDERIVYPERPEGCKVDIPGVISHSN